MIWAVSGVIYLGERQPYGHGITPLKEFALCSLRWRGDGKWVPATASSPANCFNMKTSSAIQSFFLATTLYPETVRLAQRELDEVLGGERLADFSDMPRLPYISAVVKEVLRWRPPTPLGASSCHVTLCVNLTRLAAGTPHRFMEDDTYKGWLIPAGATVMENTWYPTLFRGLLPATN